MKDFGILLYNNKTKITGFLLVVVGSLQANAAMVETLLTERQFALFTIIVGCIVAGLGFINGKRPTIQK